MFNFTILFDEPQEAYWFRNLHSSFKNADEQSIQYASQHESVRAVLEYDRPDIVLLDRGSPILSVEETIEVPSGHNVGQRFARIAAAAEAGVPFLYFCPYVAKKHGGLTAGPRFMNARLFKALDVMERVTGTAVTTINWRVDERFEVRRDPEKDSEVREYMNTFLTVYKNTFSLSELNYGLLNSEFHTRMINDRESFVQNSIRKPEQYEMPPDSVRILTRTQLMNEHQIELSITDTVDFEEAVIYRIGSRYIRSDPYTGMAMLYRYLYVVEYPARILILWFPHINIREWRKVAEKEQRKDVRLFRKVADAVLFRKDLVFSGFF